MKKIFIALSIVILAACSDNNIGGYTDSIVKNAINSQGSPKPQKIVNLAKSAAPLEEDLSSLDEDALREKLMNTYPRPMMARASAVEYFEIIHETYDDKIQDYSWEETRPNIIESKLHKYGFDRDPTERDNIVYMSVETGPTSKTAGIAYFDAHLSTATHSQYRLHLDDDDETIIPLTLDNDGNVKNIEIKTAGTYELEGCSNTFSFLCNVPVVRIWTKLNKKITLKTYAPDTKTIIYAQLDGDGWESDETECNKGYNKKCVKEFFEDSVFNQAVLKVDLKDPKELDKNFPIKNDYLITIDMNNPNDNEITNLTNKAFDLMQYSSSIGTKTYRHFVYAINKEKKVWNLKECNMENKDLSKCNKFFPEHELESAKFYMISDTKSKKCKDLGKIGKNPVAVIFKKDASGHIFAFKKEGSGKEPLNYNDCDILYTTEGYPVHPSIKGVYGGTLAASVPNINNLYDGYLPRGSVVISPRVAGKSGLYTLMHEIGHSLGLTDVSVTNLIIDPETEKFYASSETNLMSWSDPTGKKLRYRNTTPIACTGGRSFIVTVGKKEKFFDAVEYTIELEPQKEDGDIVDWLNGERKQWDCVRNCFVKEFRTTARTSYFKKENKCKEDNIIGTEPEDFYDKYIELCKKDFKNQIDYFLDLSDPKKKYKDEKYKEDWISSMCEKLYIGKSLTL